MRAFVQLHAEMIFHERAQTKLPFTQKSCSEHGVENGGGPELVMFFEQAQIVIRRVKNQFTPVENLEE